MRKPSVDKFQGCLIGCAVGDAVGAPAETWGLRECQTYVENKVAPMSFDRVARVSREGERIPFGQYTDDTQLTRELISSILACGELDPEHYAATLVDLFTNRNPVGTGRATRAAVARLFQGVPWDEAGTPPPSAGNGSAMRAAPIGLLHWDTKPRDVEDLVEDAEVQGIITHANPVCTAGSVVIACAVQQALSSAPPNTLRWWEDLTVGVSYVEHDALDDVPMAELILTLWEKREDKPEDVRTWLMEITPDFGIKWRGISSWVVASVLWSLYSFLRTPDDFWATIQTAVWPGGDVDSTAAMAGAISGAYNGLQAIPESVAKMVHDNGSWGYEELCGLAVELHQRTVES